MQFPNKGKWLQEAKIEVKHSGILEVPDDKNVDELPMSHFEKLIDSKGYEPIIRALTNLEVWNKDKNKSLSSWASNMADKLKKKYRPESMQIEDIDDDSSSIFSEDPLDEVEDTKTEGYHKDKRPGDVVVGTAKDGSPLYGRDKTIREPKQHSIDNVTIAKSGDAKLGTHDVEFDYDKDDNLVAIDKNEKELLTKAAQAKSTVKQLDNVINDIQRQLKSKRDLFDDAIGDKSKLKSDIDDLTQSLKIALSKKKNAIIAADLAMKEVNTYYN